jgi:hypothetical protein
MYVHPTDDSDIWGMLCGFNGSNGGRGSVRHGNPAVEAKRTALGRAR